MMNAWNMQSHQMQSLPAGELKLFSTGEKQVCLAFSIYSDDFVRRWRCQNNLELEKKHDLNHQSRVGPWTAALPPIRLFRQGIETTVSSVLTTVDSFLSLVNLTASIETVCYPKQ